MEFQNRGRRKVKKDKKGLPCVPTDLSYCVYGLMRSDRQMDLHGVFASS